MSDSLTAGPPGGREAPTAATAARRPPTAECSGARDTGSAFEVVSSSNNTQCQYSGDFDRTSSGSLPSRNVELDAAGLGGRDSDSHASSVSLHIPSEAFTLPSWKRLRDGCERHRPGSTSEGTLETTAAPPSRDWSPRSALSPPTCEESPPATVRSASDPAAGLEERVRAALRLQLPESSVASTSGGGADTDTETDGSGRDDSRFMSLAAERAESELAPGAETIETETETETSRSVPTAMKSRSDRTAATTASTDSGGEHTVSAESDGHRSGSVSWLVPARLSAAALQTELSAGLGCLQSVDESLLALTVTERLTSEARLRRRAAGLHALVQVSAGH